MKKWRVKEWPESEYPVNRILDFVNRNGLQPGEWQMLRLPNPFNDQMMVVFFYFAETSL